MKRMLFNATQAEELRVAIVDGQKLIDLDIESAAKEQRKSNIYKGVITRIEPSLEAAFVDYGAERHGFLPFKEVSRSYFQPGVEPNKASIKEALREGQELIVQVDKDERGNKGAALTTYISLAGRYLVLMPNNPRGGGVSRRVEGDERSELRENLGQLNVPEGMSIIARTAAIGRAADELEWDLNYLVQLWTAIDSVAADQKGPLLIYQEGSLVIRAIRDYFQPDIGEILIDTADVFEQAQAFMGQVMPGNVNRVKHYRDDVPLFSRFQIEHQIESAYSRQVNLPAGGAIVIDHTEALVSVDVNSGRATRGSDIEETAFRTNCEAADEIARQLRLRDLGGLIVIDFIDMESTKNQREVENRLRDSLRHDRARVQMGKISRFGLMELSRQRLRPALAETSYIACPRCTGTGHIRSTESAALHILRILEEEAMKENTGAVHTQVPVDVATFLLNEKRSDIQAIELRQKINILIIPNTQLETPAHKIVRLRHDDLNQDDVAQPSYRMAETEEVDAKVQSDDRTTAKPRPQAAIRSFTPDQPAPMGRDPEPAAAAPVAAQPSVPPRAGILSRFVSWLMGEKKLDETSTAETPVASPALPKSENGRRDGRRNERRGGRRDSREVRSEADKPRAPKPERDERAKGNRQHVPAEPLPPSDGVAEAAARSERGERSERGSRRGRGARKERPEAEVENPELVTAAAVEAAVQEATVESENAPLNDEGSTSERGTRGRRGRRGGRRNGERRPSDDGEVQSIESATEPANAAPEELAAFEPLVLTVPEASPAVIQSSSITEPPATVLLAEAQHEPVIVDEAPVEVTETLATPTPVATAPAVVASTRVEPIDVGTALSKSGLVMIETADTATPPAPVVSEPPAPRGRPRRTPVVIASEPMVQVETDGRAS